MTAASAHEIVAPAAWRSIDFISDLHLAENTPRTHAAWRDYLLHTSADALVILGDLFEAWIGDDVRHVGFEAEATAVLREAAARRPIALMVGNRDFLIGTEMLADCGVRALPDPCVLDAFGARTLLTHGDAWCLADVEYQQVRRVVRDPAWQARALAQPLALRRQIAMQMRTQSEMRATTHDGPWADIDPDTARAALRANRATTLVHGHTHRPGSEEIAPGVTRHVLSDWSLDDSDHGTRAEVLRWRDGQWQRLAPAAAVVD